MDDRDLRRGGFAALSTSAALTPRQGTSKAPGIWAAGQPSGRLARLSIGSRPKRKVLLRASCPAAGWASETGDVMFRRFAVTVFGVVLMLSGASVASAQTAPSVTFFPSPLPLIGTQLSDSSPAPFIQLKDGWTMSSPNGIADAGVDFCGSCDTIWQYPPPGQPGGADKVSGKYQWSQQATQGTSSFVKLEGAADDELGNHGQNSTAIFPELTDSMSATIYSPGWQTSSCKCYTDGLIRYSTKPGAPRPFRCPATGW